MEINLPLPARMLHKAGMCSNASQDFEDGSPSRGMWDNRGRAQWASNVSRQISPLASFWQIREIELVIARRHVALHLETSYGARRWANSKRDG